MNARHPEASGDFGDMDAWQQMIDRYSELFDDMEIGSRIGFVSREASGILPGKHAEALRQVAEVPMMAWQRDCDGMTVQREYFSGTHAAKVDLLLVADAEAVAAMRERLAGDTLTAIKRQLRQGGMMFFVFRNKAQLQEAGYEDFLDSLGLAFLGACR